MTDGTETEDSRFDALRSRQQFGKFASVGIVGATVDMTTLMVLTQVFGVLPEFATVIGIETAILVMFTINDRWTYASHGGDGSRAMLRRLLRSHLVRAAGSTTQFVVFVIAYRMFFMDLTVSGIDMWLFVAKITGMAIAVIVNYTAETLFTWQVHVD